MSLKHALLGFLSFGPATGYDLKHQMEQSVRHFWHADLSQIYRTLDTMREAGWVDKTIEHQQSRPPRHVYSLQEPGHEEFLRWLREPMEELPSVHNPFLLKVFFGGHLEAEALIEHLQTHRRRHEERRGFLAGLETTVPQELASRGMQAHTPCILATIRLGRQVSETYIAWCEETIREMQAHSGTPHQTEGERP